jgi:hypothetical protein
VSLGVARINCDHLPETFGSLVQALRHCQRPAQTEIGRGVPG